MGSAPPAASPFAVIFAPHDAGGVLIGEQRIDLAPERSIELLAPFEIGGWQIDEDLDAVVQHPEGIGERGGLFGIGDQLFPIPPAAITLDAAQEILLVDVQPEMLEEMPGFDLENRPDATAPNWDEEIRQYWDEQIGATSAE